MERRTILFVDQVGSTRQLADIGDAAMVGVRNRLWSVVNRAVGAHDGRVFSDEGDGGAAVFTSADGGAAAALQIVEEVAAFDLHVRVGLHEGTVVPNGSGFVGLTVHLAARLCDVAPSGHVVASAAMAAGLRNATARVTDFGHRSLKGLTDPVAVVLLSDPDREPPTMEAGGGDGDTIGPLHSSLLLARGAETMLGRAGEQTAVLAGAADGIGGDVRLVTLGGDPGAGKTTLAHHVCRRLVDDGALCLIGRADEGSNDPFHELIEMFGPLIAEAPLSLLADHVLRHGDLLTRLLPGLGDRVPSAARGISATEPAPDQRRLFEAVADLVRATGALQPLVLLFEDAHWATGPTLDLTRHLVRAGGLGPVTVLVTYRTTDVEPGSSLSTFLQRVSTEPNRTHVTLGPLDVGTVRELAAQQFPDLAGAEPEALASLADRIAHQAGGNALFCTELLRSLASDVTSAIDLTVRDVPLPASVQDITYRRVDRLGSEIASVLTDAAVLGENFTLVELQRVTASDVGVLDALDRGERAGLVRPAHADGRLFSFAHEVVQRALYARMRTAERLRRHRTAADALMGTPTASSADVLRHLERAGALATTDEIVRYASAAADDAAERLALIEAVSHRQTAVDALDSAAAAGDTPSPTDRALGALALGRAQTAVGMTAGKSSLVAAAQYAKQADDWHLFGEIAWQYGGDLKENQTPMSLAEPIALISEALDHHVAPTPLRARLLTSLALWQRQVVPYAQRRPLVDEALEIARSSADPATLVAVLAEAQRALHGPNVAHEAVERASEIERLAAELGDDGALFQGLNVRLLATIESGDIAVARITAEQLGVVAGRLRHFEGHRLTLMWQAWDANVRGDFSAMRQFAGELQTLLVAYPPADRIRFDFVIRFMASWFRGRSATLYQAASNGYGLETMLAWFAAESGHVDRVATHVAAAGGAEAVDDRLDYLWWNDKVALTRVARGTGDVALAQSLRTSILPYRDHNAVMGLVAFFGAAEHHLGTLAAVCGDLDDAVAHFDAALVRHEEMGAAPFGALTRTELAGALLARLAPGDRVRASGLVADAASVADELRLGLVQQLLGALPSV